MKKYFICFGIFLFLLISSELYARVAHHTKHHHAAPATSTVADHPLVSLSSLENGNDPAMVVIDPGHGGKDPGATGPHGVHEKNVVLAICNNLNADLDEYAAIKTRMTRNSDYFVTLRGRLSAARKNGNGDVFVAVHADSYLNDTAHGASVFVLSQHGASSESARWIARGENKAVLGGAKFSDNSKMVQSVLLNLSMTATIDDSIKLGKQVMRQLGQVTHLHTGIVEQAPFMVLKSPDIPSILVETGFISNANEEAHLNNPVFQHKVANALAQGIVNFLYRNPPQDTVIALQQAGRLKITTHKKMSVNALADSYNISADALRTANDLHGSYIKANTQVKIPAAK
jgi:N-acetylmuramoyl-L-alanine amidase